VKLDYLSKSELIYLVLFLYYLRNQRSERRRHQELYFELSIELTEKIKIAPGLNDNQRIALLYLVKSRDRELTFHMLTEYAYSSRKLRGILKDPWILKKVRKRIFRKVRPLRPRTNQRIRGYRDQGTLRPDHRWTPKEDYSLTEIQNELEYQSDVKEFYDSQVQKATKARDPGLIPVNVYELPDLFDKPGQSLELSQQCSDTTSSLRRTSLFGE
jgi:hypothetical protein